MVVFSAATALRTSEFFGLEWRDLGCEAGVVYVRRVRERAAEADEDAA